MKTVLLGLLIVASLPFVFINVSYVTFFAAITALACGLVVSSPFIVALVYSVLLRRAN